MLFGFIEFAHTPPVGVSAGGDGQGCCPVRKNAAPGGTGRTGGCLLPVLVAQIMVGVYMVGLFKNVFQQETDSVRRLPVQFLCAGIPQNLADILRHSCGRRSDVSVCS